MAESRSLWPILELPKLHNCCDAVDQNGFLTLFSLISFFQAALLNTEPLHSATIAMIDKL